jgi:hypothetical protein
VRPEENSELVTFTSGRVFLPRVAHGGHCCASCSPSSWTTWALIARYAAAMDSRDVGRMVPSLPRWSAGTVYEFAPEAEAVLRLLVDGRTVDLATLADTAGLDVATVAGLVQELVTGQAAVVGSLL